jgi:hypothetical protein
MNRQASLTPTPAASSSMPPLINLNSARAVDDAEEDFDVSQVAGINYRKGTVESDQMVLLLATVKSGCREVRRTQLWNNFFSYMCCLIGASIVTRDNTMSINDIYLAAYTRYVSFFVGNYYQIIHSGQGLFQNVPDGKIPDLVLEKSNEFLVRDNPGVVPTNFNSVVETIRAKKGKEIWENYKETKREVVNVCNLLVREIKSGENKTGVLLEIREKLFALDQQKKRAARFKRVVSEKAGTGNSFIILQR